MVTVNNKNKLWAIIPAAGIGQRMQSEVPKQYLRINAKTLLEHTIAVLLSYPGIEKIVVAVAKNDIRWPNIEKRLATDNITTVIGGQERYHSVYAALLMLRDIAHIDDWIIIHDAVRPCLRHEDLDRLISAVSDHAVGGLLGVKVRDTLKRTDALGRVINTIDRSNVWQAQSPQIFRMGKLLAALEKVINEQLIITDDASALEFLGEEPLMIEGHPDNIKVTQPEDLIIAERILGSVYNSNPSHTLKGL